MPCSQSSANPSARPKTVSARRISATVRGPACRAGCRPDPTTIRRPRSLSVVTGSRASVRPHYSITARMLGLVKRLVGALAYFGQGAVISTTLGDAEAHGDGNGFVTGADVLQEFAQPVQVVLDVAGSIARNGYAEFFAADAADDALVAETFAQSGTDPAQYFVSGQMPVHVVDLLEVVDVGQYEGERHLLVPGQVERAFGQLEETRMVAERGQTVAVREVLEAPALARCVGQQQDQHKEQDTGKHVHGCPEALALLLVLGFQFAYPRLFLQEFELLLGMLEVEVHLQISNPARALHVQMLLAGFHARLVVLHGVWILLPIPGNVTEHPVRLGQVVPGLAAGEFVQYRREQSDDPVRPIPGHFQPGEIETRLGDAAFELGLFEPGQTRFQPRRGGVIFPSAAKQVAQTAFRNGGAEFVAGFETVRDRGLVIRAGRFDAIDEFVDERQLLLGVADGTRVALILRLGQGDMAEVARTTQLTDLCVRI